MCKISIIVPVYNVENYISRCIDSILSQTFADWECLLIDDGSTDNSGDICDAYSKKDQRFIVCHKENGGVSSARNEGIEMSKGEWITFIDADDWILPEYLEHFIAEKLDNKVCLFVSSLTYTDGGDFNNKKKIKTGVFTSDSYAEMLVSKNNVITGVLGKFFLKNRIAGTRFRQGIKIGEDWLFLIEWAIHGGGKVKCVNSYFYMYYQKPDSAMHTIGNEIGPVEAIIKEEIHDKENLLRSYNTFQINTLIAQATNSLDNKDAFASIRKKMMGFCPYSINGRVFYIGYSLKQL